MQKTNLRVFIVDSGFKIGCNFGFSAVISSLPNRLSTYCWPVICIFHNLCAMRRILDRLSIQIEWMDGWNIDLSRLCIVYVVIQYQMDVAFKIIHSVFWVSQLMSQYLHFAFRALKRIAYFHSHTFKWSDICWI